MSNDPFADVLRVTEAESIVSGGIAAGGTWSFHFPPPGQIVFSAILAGGCWLRLDGQRGAVWLEQGDVGLLPGRDGFVLCSDLRARPTKIELTDRWGEIETIGDGRGCKWLAGRVALHPSSGALLTQALPPVVHLRAGATGAATLRWIVEELVEEHMSTRPGSSLASAQLAQLFLIKILRAHLTSPGTMPPGWLRAIGDERIAPALRLIHDDPARAHDLDALARAARMSRTRFAVRFKAVAGVAPLTYLTAWRMHLAQRALRDEDVSIVALAESLGYASDSSFSNAFKREIGVAPRSYRAAARGKPDPAPRRG